MIYVTEIRKFYYHNISLRIAYFAKSVFHCVLHNLSEEAMKYDVKSHFYCTFPAPKLKTELNKVY
jgi:hypothetical protein